MFPWHGDRQKVPSGTPGQPGPLLNVLSVALIVVVFGSFAYVIVCRFRSHGDKGLPPQVIAGLVSTDAVQSDKGSTATEAEEPAQTSSDRMPQEDRYAFNPKDRIETEMWLDSLWRMTKPRTKFNPMTRGTQADQLFLRLQKELRNSPTVTWKFPVLGTYGLTSPLRADREIAKSMRAWGASERTIADTAMPAARRSILTEAPRGLCIRMERFIPARDYECRIEYRFSGKVATAPKTPSRKNPDDGFDTAKIQAEIRELESRGVNMQKAQRYGADEQDVETLQKRGIKVSPELQRYLKDKKEYRRQGLDETIKRNASFAESKRDEEHPYLLKPPSADPRDYSYGNGQERKGPLFSTEPKDKKETEPGLRAYAGKDISREYYATLGEKSEVTVRGRVHVYYTDDLGFLIDLQDCSVLEP